MFREIIAEVPLTIKEELEGARLNCLVLTIRTHSVLRRKVEIAGGEYMVRIVIERHRSGRVRALAVTSLKRIPQVPSVPTMHESARPGFEMTSWYG